MEIELNPYNAIRIEVQAARSRNGGLKRGFKEVTQAVTYNTKRVNFVVKAADAEPEYHRIVRALCAELNVPLFTIDDRADLILWAGQTSVSPTRNRQGLRGGENNNNSNQSYNNIRLQTDMEILTKGSCCCVAVCGWDPNTPPAQILITQYNKLFAEELAQHRQWRERLNESKD